ncbi:MAG: hypothetical protein V7746_14285 [Halioglobus sp.]
MGFREESWQQVKDNITVVGDRLESAVSGQSHIYGALETPSLGDLRARVHQSLLPAGKMSVRQIVADVQQLHTNESEAGALFQVASQFNLLEMASPSLTPENGVAIYAQDRTQGPACAVAAGAGTIYRNYFADVNGHSGQTADRQIDCLADLGAALGNTQELHWHMRNGYVFATQQGLAAIAIRLGQSSEQELDALRALLRVGIQWQTQVTLGESQHLVSQVYCSALPVAYNQYPEQAWQAFATLVLEASYEACVCAAVLNAALHGNSRVYLTLLGGGVFGNAIEWILQAMERVLVQYSDFDLDVVIVSYGQSNSHIDQLVERLKC